MTVNQYRKKPVVIEAMLFISNIDVVYELQEWISTGCKARWDGIRDKLYLETLEGEMCANEGDWIIKGVAGEFYPCKPDIFEATYESVD